MVGSPAVWDHGRLVPTLPALWGPVLMATSCAERPPFALRLLTSAGLLHCQQGQETEGGLRGRGSPRAGEMRPRLRGLGHLVVGFVFREREGK